MNTLFGVHGCLDICSPARFHLYTAGSAPAAMTCWPVSLSACGGAAVGTLEAQAPAANDHMVMQPPPHPIAAQFSALSSATRRPAAPVSAAFPLLGAPHVDDVGARLGPQVVDPRRPILRTQSPPGSRLRAGTVPQVVVPPQTHGRVATFAEVPTVAHAISRGGQERPSGGIDRERRRLRDGS